MSSAKNLVIDVDDQKELFRVVEEYKYIGRDVDYDLEKLQVTVKAIPHTYKKKRNAETKAESRRMADEEYIIT